MGVALGTPVPDRLRVASPDLVRARIAGALLPPLTEERLGEIVLAPHQADGAERLRRIIARHGGALLADEVGLGKTFTALAVARQAARVVVVAPAVLREMWIAAAKRAGRAVVVMSYDRLSRSGTEVADADFVIADEAHHVRNPATRRYAALARLTASTPLLLLSATPVHNRERELRALVALFLGRRALSAPLATLAACVVRRTKLELAEGRGLPSVRTRPALAVAHDGAPLEALAALPPPLPPSDGGAAGALLSLLLVRLWTSSDAALLAALRRLVARAASLTAALHEGRYPTRRELTAWKVEAGGVQLAFPTLVSDHAADRQDPETLLASLDAHLAGVRHAQARVAAAVAAGVDADAQRAAHLARLLADDPARRVVAFTQFEETARELFRRLRHVPHGVLLSARGARTAAGPVPRADVLSALRNTHGVKPSSRDERFAVRLLITTDLLSEGVDLSAANTIVHVDLPWTPARLRQRVGRLRRPGSPHREIEAYTFELPAPATRVVDVVRTLQEKARTSARLFAPGDLVDGLPWLADEPPADAALSETRERLHTALARWRGAAHVPGAGAFRGPYVAYVAARQDEPWLALALVDDGSSPRLALVGESGVSTSDEAIVSALPCFDGRACEREPGREQVPDDATSEPLVARVLAAVRRWMQHLTASELAGVDPVGGSSLAPVQRALLRDVSALIQSRPRGERVRLAALAADARRAVFACAGAGAELRLARAREVIAELRRPGLRALGDVRRALASLAAMTTRPGRAPGTPFDSERPADDGTPRLLALLIACRR